MGLNYCNDSFNTFCADYIITRHKTMTYMSQQNRLAEKMNIALLEGKVLTD